MNEWNYRIRVVLSFLIAIFACSLIGLMVFLFTQPLLGATTASLLALTYLVVLILAVLAIAFFFRPRAFFSPGARVLIYALGILSSGFAIVASNEVWQICVTVANQLLHLLNPDANIITTGEQQGILFACFCGSVLTICVLAWLIERPPLTQAPVTSSTPVISNTAGLRRLRIWVECLLLPIVSISLLTIFEYRRDATSMVPGLSDATTFLRDPARLRLIGMAVAIAGAYYSLATAIVWHRQKQHIREEFSLYAALAMITLSAAVVFSVIPFGGVTRTPWATAHDFIRTTVGLPPTWPKEDWAHAVVAVVLAVTICFAIWEGFVTWAGRQSLDQYRQHLKHDTPHLLSEGIRTLYRVLLHKPLPAAYVSQPRNYDFQAPDTAVDRLDAWKDRARELVRLRTSSYALGDEARWHDLKRCWVGRNLDTGKRVLLFIVHDDIVTQLVEQLDYIDEVANQPGPEIGDIIFATLTPVIPQPRREWNSLPVHWRSEGELLDELINFSDYFHAIKRRVTVEQLPDSSLTIEQVYSDSDVWLPSGEGKSNVEGYLDAWTMETSRRQLALLGEYGQGKSTAALMWVFHRIQHWQPGQRLPLLIELRGLSPRNLTVEELLGAWGQRYNINPRALLRLIIAGRAVLIFEGFDEMDLVGDADMRLRHFRSLWCFAFDKAKILFTGRPNLFFTTPEMEQALRIGGRMANNAYCESVALVPFDLGRIADTLRNHSVSVREQILERARMNERFMDLVSRPSLLHVVASLWVDQNLFHKNPDELTSAYVLSLFIRASYRRQGTKAAGGTYSIGLTLDELAYFMAGIAVYMAANKLENQITALRLRDAFDLLLDAIPDTVSTQPRDGGEAAEPLKKRVGTDELRREGILAAVHTAGLLVNDPISIGRFSFAHKSFMEFLVAEVLVVRILDPEEEREAAICNATGAAVLTIFTLPVAVQFLAELLAWRIKGDTRREYNRLDDRFYIANHLFTALVGGWSRPLTRIRATLVFMVSTSMQQALLKGYYIPFRKAVLATLSMVVPIATAATVFGYWGSLSTVNHVLTPVMIICIMLTHAVVLRMDDDELWIRLLCWRAVCRQIPIPNDVMHRVVGTRWLPGCDNSKFRLVHESDMHVIYEKFCRPKRATIARHVTMEGVRQMLDILDDRYSRTPTSYSPVIMQEVLEDITAESKSTI